MPSFKLGPVKVSSKSGISYDGRTLVSPTDALAALGTGGVSLLYTVSGRAANVRELTSDYWAEKAGLFPPKGGYPSGGGGYGGEGQNFATATGIDPFEWARMAADFNAKAQPFVLDLSTKQGFELARQGTLSNVSSFLSTINTVSPGYGKLLREMETGASNFMAGRLPQEAKDLLYREASERGVARGVFGQRAQYEGLTSIRDKQLQVMELGFNQATALRAESDRIAQSLIVNPVTTTLDLYSRNLPLFTIAVGQALGVAEGNANRELQAEQINAQTSLGFAGLALQREKFEYEKQQAEAARKAQEKSGIFSLIGTGLGAAIGSFGGVPGALLGSQIGGALGGAAAGNYGSAATGLGSAIGTTYTMYENKTGIFAPQKAPTGTTLDQIPGFGGGTLGDSMRSNVIGGGTLGGSRQSTLLGGTLNSGTLTFTGY